MHISILEDQFFFSEEVPLEWRRILFSENKQSGVSFRSFESSTYYYHFFIKNEWSLSIGTGMLWSGWWKPVRDGGPFG